MISYVSLEDFKAIRNIDRTTHDQQLRSYLLGAKRFIDTKVGYGFYPKRDIRTYPHPPDAVKLFFSDWLLELETLVTNNGDTTIPASDYILLTGSRQDLTPYDRVYLLPDSEHNVFLWSGNADVSNTVTGIWGFHDDYDEAWVYANTTLQNAGGIPASSTSTVLDVSSLSGSDNTGRSPKIQTYDLIKIGDEFMNVTSIDTTSDTVTVARAVNGSLLAAHAQLDPIYRWSPIEEIVLTARRLTAYFYAQRSIDSYEVQVDPAGGSVNLPAGIPKDVWGNLMQYQDVFR